MTPELTPYWALMTAFVEGRLHASEFEPIFFRLFQNDPIRWPREIFELLNRLHTDADAYTPDPSLRDRYDLDENQLRDRATKTLRELEEVLHAL